MIGWDRCGNSIIGVFSPRQILWLRKHLLYYLNRVDRGLLSGCYDDPVLVAVFANITDDIELRLRRTRQAITTSLQDLPVHGGVVEFRGELNRLAWIWTLQELSIAVAARLGADPPRGSISTSDFDTLAKLQSWLSGIVEVLVNAGVLPATINDTSDATTAKDGESKRVDLP